VTSSDDTASSSASAATSANVNSDVAPFRRRRCCGPPDDKQMQLTDGDASDGRTRRQDRIGAPALSESDDDDGVSSKSSRDENGQRPARDTGSGGVVSLLSAEPELSGSSRLSSARTAAETREPLARGAAAARSPSPIASEVDVEEDARPSSDERRRRLAAMKTQLRNARPVAPPSATIDSLWDSGVAGRLTPAARARSAVWTPYDELFFAEETATAAAAAAARRLNSAAAAADERMWRTQSLQTLPGRKLGRSDGPGDGTVDLLEPEVRNSAVGESGRAAEASFDKSRSLADLRRTVEDGPHQQVREVGSVDVELNVERTRSPPPPARSLRPRCF